MSVESKKNVSSGQTFVAGGGVDETSVPRHVSAEEERHLLQLSGGCGLDRFI